MATSKTPDIKAFIKGDTDLKPLAGALVFRRAAAALSTGPECLIMNCLVLLSHVMPVALRLRIIA
jgi:hypothetical protein